MVILIGISKEQLVSEIDEWSKWAFQNVIFTSKGLIDIGIYMREMASWIRNGLTTLTPIFAVNSSGFRPLDII